jgi:hypothetical protein
MVAVAGALVITCVGVACAGSDHRRDGIPETMWTERQAASITSIRGTSVRVRYCRGLGRGQDADGSIVFKAFKCLAGTRIASQPIDTVAVTYVLRPRGPYEGAGSRLVLENVRFEALSVP